MQEQPILVYLHEWMRSGYRSKKQNKLMHFKSNYSKNKVLQKKLVSAV